MTSAQLTTLASDIAANAATIGGVAIKDLPKNGDTAVAVSEWYSQFSSPDYFVWDSGVKVTDIFNTVAWANYTPSDAPDNTVTYQNRAILCQTKQMNLQLLLQGRTTFDATRLNLRVGLNDATTNLPSGASGASRSGGWTAILPVLSRKAKRVEKLFAVDDGAGIGNTTGNPRGDTTNPDTAAYEGSLTDSDVRAAWGI